MEAGGERARGKMTNLIVANGRYQGGGMLIAPDAEPDDGLFDVLLIGDITKRDFVLNVGKIYRGTHLSHPKIDLLRSATVSVDAEVAVPIELDGEQPGTTPARFEVVPRRAAAARAGASASELLRRVFGCVARRRAAARRCSTPSSRSSSSRSSERLGLRSRRPRAP